ncbi:MAG: recombinase family protein [Anaerolineae bacterium]|nr:recombinase family protein [Anaerolineae bacterium]
MSKRKVAQRPEILRYAVYCRYSDEIQNELSLESQELMCREEITKRGGIVTGVYKDAAKFGWSLDRDGFIEMRDDAAHEQFDAVMMWKFDRLARDHTQVTAIKALFRIEYGVRLFCVEGFSEDDDSSPYSAMMEQMLAVFSAFYSKNLSTEVKRANHHRHVNGKPNGSKPAFGYFLATEKTPKRAGCVKATPDMPPGLYLDPRAAVLVRWAFRLYAKGGSSYLDIALFLTEKAKLLRRPLEKPFNPQTVRDMLQNKTYCGFVSYTETVYTRGFGQGKAGIRGRREWNQGIHRPIISEELYEQCQAVREDHARKHKNPRTVQPHLLMGLIYCARCLAQKPVGSKDNSHGKMYTHPMGKGARYYECSATRRGYDPCGQKLVREESIDTQVVETLFRLHEKLPPDVTRRIEEILRKHAHRASDAERMEQIKDMVKRIDFSWEKGFMEEEEYVAKRRQLQLEIESLRPVEQDELLKSADLLKNFRSLWERCTTPQMQHELIQLVVDGVIVLDNEVIALALKGDTALLLVNDDDVSDYGERGTRTLTS